MISYDMHEIQAIIHVYDMMPELFALNFNDGSGVFYHYRCFLSKPDAKRQQKVFYASMNPTLTANDIPIFVM